MNKQLKELKNYRMIEATFLPPTNTRGARFKIFERGRSYDQSTTSKIFSYRFPYNSVEENAQSLLEKSGFVIVCKSWNKDSFVFLCDNWGSDFLTIKDIKE